MPHFSLLVFVLWAQGGPLAWSPPHLTLPRASSPQTPVLAAAENSRGSSPEDSSKELKACHKQSLDNANEDK
jgi:hypothetical protein